MTKTVVFGAVKEIKYELVTNLETEKTDDGKEVSYYTKKPYIKEKVTTKEWKEICSYEGNPQYNPNDGITWKRFYISEDENVTVVECFFRADLNEYHVRTNKVLETIEVDKEKSEKALAKELKKYNAAAIEADENLKAYCDLHKLKYEDTDPDELKRLIPGKANESQTKIPLTFTLNNDTDWSNIYKQWTTSNLNNYTTSTSTNFTFKL